MYVAPLLHSQHISDSVVAEPLAGPSSATMLPDGLAHSLQEMSINYVKEIKQRFGENEQYKEFIDILESYHRTPPDEVRLALPTLQI